MGLQIPKRARRTVVATVVAATALLVTGCSQETKDEWSRFAMPEPATKEAPLMLDLWVWSWVAALIVGVIVWALIFYVVIRYRRRSEDQVPVQTRYHLPLEIFYTIAPIMMVIVFFHFTVDVQEKVLKVDDDPDHSVTVSGFQWSWAFNYEDEPAVDGETVWDSGTTAKKPTLWLVEDETVTFKLYSPDVVHSFWIPAFLFKMDIIPGRENSFTVTPDRQGTFEGRCAELCGVRHSRMLFDVKVVSQEAFDAHLEELRERGNTGENLGGIEVEETPGLETAESNGGEQ